jgi:hypothetical protein
MRNSPVSIDGGVAPTCPNCSIDRPVFMSPIPEDFVEIENATHECPKCRLKTSARAQLQMRVRET